MLRVASEIMKPIVPPNWAENEVVLDRSPYWMLRKFRGSGNRHEVVSLFPPFSGRSGHVCANIIRACQDEGFDTYVFELLPAHNGAVDLERLISFGLEAYEFPTQPKILTGCCQGAWNAAIISCLSSEKPIAYFNFAGPIDFSSPSWINTCCKIVPQALIDWSVRLNGGVRNGWMQWCGMASFDPYAVTWGEWTNFVLAVWGEDQKALTKCHRNRNWYWSPEDLSVWFLDAYKFLFLENRLVKGRLRLLGQDVDLKRVDWPVHLFAGSDDKITPPEQTFAMERYVRGPITKRLFDGCGHTKTFCGSEPLSVFRKDLRRVAG